MKLSITAPVTLIDACPNYAIAEGTIEIPDEDYAKFKANPEDYINTSEDEFLLENCIFQTKFYELECYGIKVQDVNYAEI